MIWLKLQQNGLYRLGPLTKKAREGNENVSVWTTNFPKHLKLTKKERQLNSNLLVEYKCPHTIATLLSNYKIQPHAYSIVIGGSHPCEKFLLWGRSRNSEK